MNFENFTISDVWVEDQFIMDLPTYKHNEHECYISQYCWRTKENLKDSNLWCMMTSYRKDGLKVTVFSRFSNILIAAEEVLEDMVQNELKECEKEFNKKF